MKTNISKGLADLILKTPWWFYSRLPIRVVKYGWLKGSNDQFKKDR